VKRFLGRVLCFAWLAECAPREAIYITGDTLFHDRLKLIPLRYPDIDIALLHLGGTRLLGLLLTMDAEQGVEAVKVVRAGVNIPIHYNDYDFFRSPLDDFRRAIERAGLEERLAYLGHGDVSEFSVRGSAAQRARIRGGARALSPLQST
jgi:L-ascorbate metabolism protein UlaG (beta-lactamase superfamily)